MTKGGTTGAAAPVLSGGGETKAADEKSVSYLRKEFRATAEVRKRPPELAQAMVDADVEIAGVITKGKLLTLTTSETLEPSSDSSPEPATTQGGCWSPQSPRPAPRHRADDDSRALSGEPTVTG